MIQNIKNIIYQGISQPGSRWWGQTVPGQSVDSPSCSEEGKTPRPAPCQTPTCAGRHKTWTHVSLEDTVTLCSGNKGRNKTELHNYNTHEHRGAIKWTSSSGYALIGQVKWFSVSTIAASIYPTFPLLCVVLSDFFILFGTSSAGCSSLSAEPFPSGLSSRMLSVQKVERLIEAPWCSKRGEWWI